MPYTARRPWLSLGPYDLVITAAGPVPRADLTPEELGIAPTGVVTVLEYELPDALATLVAAGLTFDVMGIE